MENQAEYNFSQEVENTNKRPQFLTVLCILSFICCGLMFVSTLWGIAFNTPERQMEQIEQMRQFSPAAAEQMEAQLAEQQGSVMMQVQPYISILLLLASFFGVLQMFKQKKTGFYIYVAAELIPYLFMLMGGEQARAMISSMGGIAQTAAIVTMIIMVASDLAFIGMYAANLKHMK